MTKDQRIRSILSEIEYGYIGYDNLHGDDDQGLEIIKESLEKQLPKKIVPNSHGYPQFCPLCGKSYPVDYPSACNNCGQRLEV